MKTSELIGTALDWAVAKAYGVRVKYDSKEGLHINNITGWFHYRPSTEWAQGGPIIERERIELRRDGDGGWIACDNIHPEFYGPTPLVAAMRCFVASVLGDEVDIDQTLGGDAMTTMWVLLLIFELLVRTGVLQ